LEIHRNRLHFLHPATMAAQNATSEVGSPRRSARNARSKPNGIQKHHDIRKPSGIRKSIGAQKSSDNLKSIDVHKYSDIRKSGDTQKVADIQKASDIEKPKEITKFSNIQKPSGILKPASGTQNKITIFHKTADTTKRVTLITPPNSAQDAENSPPFPPTIIKEAAWVEPKLAPDNLLEQPTSKTLKYLDSKGRKKFDERYVMKAQTLPPIGEQHPKIRKAERNNTYTRKLRAYHEQFDPTINIPLAGISREPPYPDYPTDQRILGHPTDGESADDVFWCAIAAYFGGQSPEDNFHHRPSIKIPVPDHLKSMLVDDWENVTKNQQLVPLPHPHPVDEILNDYLAYEKPNRQEGSASLDILEEAMAGLREYFDKSLGRILLYRFERVQYHEMHKLWSQPDGKNKSAVDTYGAEHLSRLLVSLPELIAQTNMDQQSVNRLREELMKFINWFSRHVVKYFVSQYETPGAGYVQQVDSA
jgi:mortality factor 4-like protein 1